MIGFIYSIIFKINYKLKKIDTTQIRSELKQYIDKLSPEKLILVADFFRDLEEEETEETKDATEELLNISGFKSAFEKANQEVKEGKVQHCRTTIAYSEKS